MKPVTIVNTQLFSLLINRLCHQLIENHKDFSESAIIGLQPRGIYLANRLKQRLEEITGKTIQTGALDITFYRDDFRRRDVPLLPSVTNLDFSIENKDVILVDDVLYTGRTVRSGLDALIAYGRPRKVELLALIDRRFKRQIPIQADYVGKWVDTLSSEKVAVEWRETEGEDKVILFTPKEHE
ncbi:MAG TPA: bifunctional pyr operon transcriptional regulator/uracil phosphoribosyltransferase PyrR [Flavobacteriales bacterium]|nr:bifunctional pyr operon transcriptional regulator/uracil phosphoribosyltransferase PyrR [Flavobacteriales bacterium]HRE75879.1 bifunctional pyr operon transcriptional regulator/uracil phosphoribosyltransferase PyrR [Flavobacteriales bacterium]HRE97347.1 bifunctional pyr operon transcriptional regulator/uracil phosphoribosyltransferase PyrR [Flavobacteriales bacterium]HRJ34401.1 bifunctional pyr operon transcriptional regulator/uracil phosphoribosyltransferase PyrR [Flavobacteriales bacterium]